MFGRVQRKALAVSALISLAALLGGCGQDQALNPISDFTGQQVLLPPAERPVAQTGPQGVDYGSVTAVVSAASGGSVTLGRYTLDFPPGALSADTPITIRQVDPVAMVIALEPHGIQFNVPVTLSARVGDLLPPGTKNVGVAWFNDATGQWEVVGESHGAAPFARAGLWHFSDYEAFSDG